MKRLLAGGALFCLVAIALTGCGSGKKEERESMVLTLAAPSESCACADDPNTQTVAETEDVSSFSVNGFRFEVCDEMVYVNADGINLREKPGRDGKIAGHLFLGKKVQRTGRNARWSRILVNGKTYYVSAELLSDTEPQSSAAPQSAAAESTAA